MSRKTLFAAVLIVAAAAVAGGGWAHLRAAEQPPLPMQAQADRILVEKSARTLTLYSAGAPLKTYRVAIGKGNPGDKRREGDGRTPEGFYRITGRNPQSVAHLSLRVSYPEPHQVLASGHAGVSPGGDIMIHGIMNGYGWIGRLHRLVNWTDGCVAVTDWEMDELWRAVPDGTPIEIRA
ncbi:L,D-transpeptidase family protein [Methylopila sp. M107]|uniref:L,D-transpeptidase family protein n=1 Tax=Methylopila sp. M107 TaxID=1101190 RepID=UPI00037474E4|nr:L,D-transpeptidase family protein [Methylopila sp. M107]